MRGNLDSYCELIPYVGDGYGYFLELHIFVLKQTINQSKPLFRHDKD